jgi:hypothetical protein
MGSGPAGFQASIGSTQDGDEFYSPFWRIQMATWADAETAPFLSTTAEITEAASNDDLTTTLGGFVVNCPFVEVVLEDDSMMDDTMEDTMTDHMDDGPAMSPIMQMKEGVAPSQVLCNEGLQLMLKKSNGSAICVSSESASILMQRGYATQP